MIPAEFKKYFWDIDFKKFDVRKNSSYIIGRILEYGDEEAAKWMFKNFKKTQIKNTLFKKRGVSRKSANYWALMLGIPKNKILCLKKSYQAMQKRHWPY